MAYFACDLSRTAALAASGLDPACPIDLSVNDIVISEGEKTGFNVKKQKQQHTLLVPVRDTPRNSHANFFRRT